MKKLIHTDNYESFYLDYLEGTLSEEERIAFEEFLAAHPELQVDEELLILDDAPEFMGVLEKELLKKEEDDRVITHQNLDYFAIAKVEQVLSPKEEKLLAGYLSANPEAQKTISAYEETRLQPSAIVYPNKEELKEKEVAFVSWRFIAGIASAAALLLLFFQLGFGSKEAQPTTVAQQNQATKDKPANGENREPKKQVLPAITPAEENKTFVAQKNEVKSAPKPENHESPNQKVKKSEEQILPVQPEMDKNLLGDKTPMHHPTILPEVKDNKQPVAPTLNNEVNKAPSKDLASHTGSSSNMKNPIPIITNTLSEKTKTPVDFKTGKATETEKGGFFLKIGKFEVSHKSSKKK